MSSASPRCLQAPRLGGVHGRVCALEIDGRAFAGLTSKEIKSVGDIVQFTKHAREKYGLSEQYLALDFQDGDAFLCIDTAHKGADDESPVVEFGAGYFQAVDAVDAFRIVQNERQERREGQDIPGVACGECGDG